MTESLYPNHEFDNTPRKPIYDFLQPDGRIAQLDMTTPGYRGDFAFSDVGRGYPEDFYYAYHTETKAIFSALMTHMSATGHMGDVDKIIDELHRTTDGMSETDSNPHSDFSQSELDGLAEANANPSLPAEQNYPASGTGDDIFRLVFTEDDVIIAMQRSEIGEYSVTIPGNDIWKFVAGMVWRSYRPANSSIAQSNISTTSYRRALDICRGSPSITSDD